MYRIKKLKKGYQAQVSENIYVCADTIELVKEKIEHNRKLLKELKKSPITIIDDLPF